MRFDHLVHWVRDRTEAMDAYRALGFHVVEGGSHPGRGTHNALCHFRLPYVEIIAVEDDGLVAKAPGHIQRGRAELLARGGGALTFAIAVPDLDAARRALGERGIPVGDPVPGARRRPDGSLLSWRMAPVEEGPAWRPFLIEWGDDDEARLSDLRRRGVIATGEADAWRTGHLVVATPDPEGDAAWAARLAGRAASAGGTGWERTTRVGKRLFVPLPGCGLEFEPARTHGIARLVVVRQPVGDPQGASGHASSAKSGASSARSEAAPASPEDAPAASEVCGLTVVRSELRVLRRARQGVVAFGYHTGQKDMFVVRAGSTLVKEIQPSLVERVRAVRRELAAHGGIEDAGNVLRLTRDHLFGSSSAAAAFVVGASANGKHNWPPAGGAGV